MIYKTGTRLIDRESGIVYSVIGSTLDFTQYQGAGGTGSILTGDVPQVFIVEGGPIAPPPASALDAQVGGDHYKKLGEYQPWEVLRRWLTPEEFRGYMKGSAITYLAREQDKGGMQDVEKAAHTLQGLIEMLGAP